MPASKPERRADAAPAAAGHHDKPSEDDAGTNGAGEDAAAEPEAIPMNRAERRAKGKKHGGVPAVGKVQPSHVNLTHGPRSYTNRRSGGG